GNSKSSGLAATALSPPGTDGLIPSGAIVDPTKLVNPAAFGSLLSGLTIYGAIADSVDVYARFLESTNRFRVLQRPIIYTKNNQKATILSGQQVPVPTSTLTQPLGGTTNNTAITSNIEYKPVVLKLEVIPFINSDREVNLTIAQTNDSITG